MKKKAKKNISILGKNLKLNVFKALATNPIKNSKKKILNFYGNYQKQKEKEKIAQEKILKIEKNLINLLRFQLNKK